MAQTANFVIANDAGAAVRARLNEVIAALQSTSAGGSAPTATVAGMLWVDTSVSQKWFGLFEQVQMFFKWFSALIMLLPLWASAV
jgi:hypothetical protein